MEARENLRNESEALKVYSSQINFDKMFFKGQIILGAILIVAFLLYFLWTYSQEVISAL
ncbi:MAG: hypothetical protein ABJ092_14455 [Gillisia sp.]